MKVIKKIIEWIQFIFFNSGKIKEEMVNSGACDYSGQGRNQYGN